MQLKTDNSPCSGLWAHCRRLRPSMIVAMCQAATFIFCLSVLLALPAVCLAQQEFLNPLYTQQDLTTHRLLPGIWEAKVDGFRIIEHLVFRTAEDGCYNLTLKVLSRDADDAETEKVGLPLSMKFKVCLVRLGQMVFLDVQAKTVPVAATAEVFHLASSPGSDHENPFSPGLFHLDGRFEDGGVLGLFVTLEPVRGQHSPGDQPEYELRLTPAHSISRVWISEDALRLSEFAPDGDVTTLSTLELQKLVLKYADDAAGFDKADEFKRKDGGLQ